MYGHLGKNVEVTFVTHWLQGVAFDNATGWSGVGAPAAIMVLVLMLDRANKIGLRLWFERWLDVAAVQARAARQLTSSYARLRVSVKDSTVRDTVCTRSVCRFPLAHYPRATPPDGAACTCEPLRRSEEHRCARA